MDNERKSLIPTALEGESDMSESLEALVKEATTWLW
jgi:hypothetical protein